MRCDARWCGHAATKKFASLASPAAYAENFVCRQTQPTACRKQHTCTKTYNNPRRLYPYPLSHSAGVSMKTKACHALPDDVAERLDRTIGTIERYLGFYPTHGWTATVLSPCFFWEFAVIFTSTCETLFKPYVAEWKLLDHLPLFWIGNHTYTTSCTDSTFPRTPNSLSRNSSHILSSINKTWCHQQSLAPKTSGLPILFLLGFESGSSFICSTYTYPNLTVVYLRFVYFLNIYTYPSCISYPIQRSAFLWAFWWDFGSYRLI